MAEYLGKILKEIRYSKQLKKEWEETGVRLPAKIRLVLQSEEAEAVIANLDIVAENQNELEFDLRAPNGKTWHTYRWFENSWLPALNSYLRYWPQIRPEDTIKELEGSQFVLMKDFGKAVEELQKQADFILGR